MTADRPFRTITDIRQAAADIGSHWFSPDTMRFFRTRLCPATVTTVADGALFVTSEQPPYGAREYRIRFAHSTECGHAQRGDVVTHSGPYETRAAAVRALTAAAAEWTTAAAAGL